MESDCATSAGPSRHSASLSLRNRFSNLNVSLLSLSSIRTLLPQYSAVDNSLDDPPPDALSGPRPPSRNAQPILDPHFQNDSEPPSYTSSSVEGEFRYSFPIRPKKPWATLHLRTRDVLQGNMTPLHTQPRVPRIWSCDPIRGALELDLDNPQTIQQISISVCSDFDLFYIT